MTDSPPSREETLSQQQQQKNTSERLGDMERNINQIQQTLQQLTHAVTSGAGSSGSQMQQYGQPQTFPFSYDPLAEGFRREVRKAVAEAIDTNAVDAKGQWILRREVVSEALSR